MITSMHICPVQQPRIELLADWTHSAPITRHGASAGMNNLRLSALHGSPHHELPILGVVRGDLGSCAARVAATACDDCPRSDQACPAARHGSSGQCLVSVLVSFTPVRRRSLASACSCSRRPRTVVNAGERRAALLESVLGATPQEFESPILRASDLRRY